MLFWEQVLFFRNSQYFGQYIGLKAIANECVKKRVLSRLWSLERVRSSSWWQKKAIAFENNLRQKKMAFRQYYGFYGRLRRKCDRQLPLKIDFLQNVPKSQKRCAWGCYIGKQPYFWKSTSFQWISIGFQCYFKTLVPRTPGIQDPWFLYI